MKPIATTIKAMAILTLTLVFGTALSALAYEMQASNDNGVRVTVTPKTLSANQPAAFDIRLNTHSVPLDQDLTAVSELKDDQGRRYLPDRWEGSPPGGHHRNGTLVFPNLEPSVKSVTLTIRNVAQIPERTFNWQIAP
jgi:hypothetical protein